MGIVSRSHHLLWVSQLTASLTFGSDLCPCPSPAGAVTLWKLVQTLSWRVCRHSGLGAPQLDSSWKGRCCPHQGRAWAGQDVWGVLSCASRCPLALCSGVAGWEGEVVGKSQGHLGGGRCALRKWSRTPLWVGAAGSPHTCRRWRTPCERSRYLGFTLPSRRVPHGLVCRQLRMWVSPHLSAHHRDGVSPAG